MIRLGLLGCGRIGQVHALSIGKIAEARLVAVADAIPSVAQSLADRYSAESRDPNAMITSDDIDAVIIATPTDTHYDTIHTAAAAGKAIFCEKPIELSSERVRDCIDAVAKAGVPFLTAFNRRFDPSFAQLEQRLRDGEIGDLELVAITSRDPAPPPIDYITKSGGLFRDMMIHDLDMARFLLGEEPVELFAIGSCLVDPEIGKAGDVDTAVVTLKTASGRICQISNSRRASYGYDQRIEVHGSKGMLSAGNALQSLVQIAGPSGFRSAPAKHFFLERYEAAYLAEMTHFIDALMHGRALSPDANDGLRAQILADAAAQSSESERLVKFEY